jgi:hypothetical protein
MSDSKPIKPAVLASAIRKVQRANKHVIDLEELIADAKKAGAGALFAEDDPERKAVKLSVDYSAVLAVIPDIQLIVGDAIHNLRTALDHLAYAVVLASGETPLSHLYFPIDTELRSLVSQPSFRKIQRVAPQIADLIVNEIKPYGTGNLFVKLNHLDRIDKHRLLLVHTATAQAKVYMSKDDDYVPDEAVGSFILIPANPTRIPKPGSHAATHNQKYRHLAFEIQFDAGLPFENEPVVPSLHQLVKLVASVINTFATCCVRGQPA